MQDVMQKLHNSEINSSISSFYDGQWTVKLGDEMNGFIAEATVSNFSEAVRWLDSEARKRYPNSWYATGKYPDGYHAYEGGASG